MKHTRYTLRIAGEERGCSCEPGTTILQALIAGGIFMEANCGGRGTCGKCKIQLLQGQVTGKDGTVVQPEHDNIYQACQVYPGSDLTIAWQQAEASQKGQAANIIMPAGVPLVEKVVVTPVYPTVTNHYSLQQMVVQAVAEHIPADSPGQDLLDNLAVLRQLQEVADTKPERLTAVLFGNTCIAIEAGDTSDSIYGTAFDIGTTTVVGMLVDMKAGKIVGVASKNNPQASMGADVISRIQAARELAGGLERLTQLIRQCLNQIIGELCSAAGIMASQIYAGTIAGNATMAHLLLGVSPAALVHQPYAALFTYAAPLSAPDIELTIHPQGKVVLLPNIASFVGSDTTAAILAVDQDVNADQVLLVDLGTNGEMVFGNCDRLCVCSTAAGPAFEGAHLRDGMRAATGAISDVQLTEQGVLLQVIGNARPGGICGSGLVKAVAEMLKTGILQASGRFNKPEQLTVPAALRQRLKKREGQWEFVLQEGENSGSGDDISITQSDVRQLQLVKSSICTGIQFLLERCNSTEQIKVCLAGAFGNYIDIDSALAIGMLPGLKREQVTAVGNAAGTGAIQVLLSVDNLRRCREIVSKAHYIELAAQPDFQARFLQNLNFPKS